MKPSIKENAHFRRFRSKLGADRVSVSAWARKTGHNVKTVHGVLNGRFKTKRGKKVTLILRNILETAA